MDPDFLIVEKLARASRSLARAVIAVKAICVVAFLFAGGFFLYGLSRFDRGDDIIEFSVLAMVIAAVALLFWSIVSFHMAAVHGLGLLGSLHGKLDALLGAMAAGAAQANEAAARRTARRPRAEALAEGGASETPAHASREDAREVSGVIPTPVVADAPGTAAPGFALSAPDTTEVAPVPPAVSAVAATSGGAPAEHPAEQPTKPAPRPEPTDGVDTKTCRACGSEIRADATRCRWCMKAA